MNKIDLQIGNYINYEQTTHIVNELHSDKIIHYWIGSNSDGYVTSYNDISAIVVDSKELKKFGFKYYENTDSHNGYWEKNGFIISLNKEKTCFYFSGLSCYTVNKLQQLYKLYINKELIYEEIM